MAVPVQIRERVNFHKDIYSGLIRGLMRQKSAGEFCDVILRVNGRQFFAHKAVLAASSPYFRSMFTSHMKEETSAEVDLSESLTLNNDDTFKNILNFMYSGDIDITVDNAEDILRTSDFLLLDDLKDYCRQFFLQHGNLNLSNCLCVCALAEQHNLEEISYMARLMVQSRFHDYLLYGEEVLELPESLFLKMVKDDKLTKFCNLDILVSCILRWVKQEEYERQNSVSKFLSCMKLSQLSQGVIKQLLNEPSVLRHEDLFNKLQDLESNIFGDEDGACSRPLYPQIQDVENNSKVDLLDSKDTESTIIAFTCNAALKYIRMLCYRIKERQWYTLPLKSDILVKNVPSRLGISGIIQNSDILYMFLSYNLPYPTDMTKIQVLALSVITGEHTLMNFRHRYNSTECCQTTLTDDRSVPPAMAYCNDCLCIIGNMEGTGHIYVCDLTSRTYMCYPLPNTRFVSLARVVTKESRYLYIWCRHRFGHEEYCINKEVSFVMFDVRNKIFNLLDVPTPPGISYGEFGDPHVLCLEDGNVIIHSPGKSSLVLDEECSEWLTHPCQLPTVPKFKTPIEMPYHGYELYSYCQKRLFVFQNPAAYTTSLCSLDVNQTSAEIHPPPPLDGISLAVNCQLPQAFIHALPRCILFDDSYTRLIHNKGGYLDFDTEDSETAANSNSDNDFEYDGYVYDEEIYGYYDDYE